jgi:hypothetical protein
MRPAVGKALQQAGGQHGLTGTEPEEAAEARLLATPHSHEIAAMRV